MAIHESKKWAEGLTQVEFERQWALRFPAADVIPLGSEWINIPLRHTHGIDSIPPSYEFEPDNFIPEPLDIIKDIKDVKVVKKEKESGKAFIPKLSK